jgi:retrotransposon gag protein
MVNTRSGPKAKEGDESPEGTNTPTETPVVQQEPQQTDPIPSRQGSLDNTANLAEAIMLMTETLKNRDAPSGKRAKAKEPDIFDGSDPKKLNNFILLCELYFRTNPSAYEDDTMRVTFAVSHLRGTALDYFEPALLEVTTRPDWFEDWEAFVTTLRDQFGPVDPTGEAENSLDHLKMQDNHHILKYNVDFNRLAIRTGWDDSVLRHRYYSGLAERIKDVMGQQGKPPTLQKMKTLAHAIDSRYWERQREKSRSGKGKSDDGDKSDKKNKDKADDKKTPPSAGSSGNNNSNNNSGNKNKNKSGKPPSTSGASSSSNPLADKLGKDGKLTQQERQRRFDNHLCMFCGGVGHTAANCNKASSSAAKAKARSAQAKEKEPVTTDSKKG